MARYSKPVTDQNGVPLLGAIVTVTDGKGQTATLTDDGGGPLANPITIGSSGFLTFNAPDAVYILTYRFGGRQVREDEVIVGEPPEFAGPAGPAQNYRASLAALKAAATSDAISTYDKSTWFFQTGNYTGKADDINIVKADSTSLALGAWVRQPSSALTFQAPQSLTIINAQRKLAQVVSVEDFGAQAGGVSHDDTGAFADIIATGRTPYVPIPKDTAGNVLAYGVGNIPLRAGTHIRGEKSGVCGGPKILIGSAGSAAFRDATTDYTAEIYMENLSVRAAPGVTNARFIDKTDLSKYLAYATFRNIETHKNLRYSYRGNFIFGLWDNLRDGYLELGEDNLVTPDTIHCGIQSLPAAWNQGNEPNINKVHDSHFFGAFGGEAAIDIRYGHQWGIFGCDFESLSCAGVAMFGVGMVEIAGGWAEAINNAQGVFRVLGYPNVIGAGSSLHLHDYTIRMTGTATNLIYLDADPCRADVNDVGVFFADGTKRLMNDGGRIGINRNVRAYIGQAITSAEQPAFHTNSHRDAVMTGGRQLRNGASDNGIMAFSDQLAGGMAASDGFLSRSGITVGTSFVTVATSRTGLGGTVTLSGYNPDNGAQFRVTKDWLGTAVRDQGAAAINLTGKTLTFQAVGNDLQMSVDAGSLIVSTTLVH